MTIERQERLFLASLICAVALLIGPGLAIRWYRSGMQQAVYARQGIEMTRWEIFIGCEPDERQIHFAEEGH